MSEWQRKAFCSNGHMIPGPYDQNGNVAHDSLFHLHQDICPTCGELKNKSQWSYNWSIKTVRWIGESVWWKPSTWGSGRWDPLNREIVEAG